MRRIAHLSAGLLCLMLTAALIVPAAAHGCHGGRSRGYQRRVQTVVTVCPYEDRSTTGRHVHDGIIYCGYSHESGFCDNACRALCVLEDCCESGRHLHDGVTYCGYGHESGFCDGTCQALCSLEDCWETGRHLHDGVTYCGYAHENGFCDGSCVVPAGRGCRHHG